VVRGKRRTDTQMSDHSHTDTQTVTLPAAGTHATTHTGCGTSRWSRKHSYPISPHTVEACIVQGRLPLRCSLYAPKYGKGVYCKKGKGACLAATHHSPHAPEHGKGRTLQGAHTARGSRTCALGLAGKPTDPSRNEPVHPAHPGLWDAGVVHRVCHHGVDPCSDATGGRTHAWQKSHITLL